MNCRYFYRNGLCAHQAVGDRFCVGMEFCPVMGKDKGSYNIREFQPVCKYDLGYGMYCKKYRKFFCPGSKNCVTEEDYLKHFDIYRRKLGALKK